MIHTVDVTVYVWDLCFSADGGDDSSFFSLFTKFVSNCNMFSQYEDITHVQYIYTCF